MTTPTQSTGAHRLNLDKEDGALEVLMTPDFTGTKALREVKLILDANQFSNFQDDMYATLFEQCVGHTWRKIHLKVESGVLFTRRSFIAVGPPVNGDHFLVGDPGKCALQDLDTDESSEEEDELSQIHDFLWSYITDADHSKKFCGQFLLQPKPKACIESLLQLGERHKIRTLILEGPIDEQLKEDLVQALCTDNSTVIDNGVIRRAQDPNSRLKEKSRYATFFKDMVVINNHLGRQLERERLDAPDRTRQKSPGSKATIGLKMTRGGEPFLPITERSMEIEFGWLACQVARKQTGLRRSGRIAKKS
ncbi:hypothetical protein P152DRAFT_174507 [Eremomyces bilateralis CBS 781.70]|uniref:Uncharacterized protein n=1 Tax=Eremomyces bilateralis CBS 781.70 TaxID=1392243 RepID=A0A6G1FTC9_9PEZI|nr:uncharacterized protein P152DRAFT_174507 [Eremomyces bilateralis CBS 781.70]KAF1809047.1 hypothetical protein P152DRAFT_174507 [Eremomyces bilateralis CBS 781.70]